MSNVNFNSSLSLSAARGHGDQPDAVIGLADGEFAVGAQAVAGDNDVARNLQVARGAVQRQGSADLHAKHALGNPGGLYGGTHKPDFGVAGGLEHILSHGPLHFVAVLFVDLAGHGERACVDLKLERGLFRRFRVKPRFAREAANRDGGVVTESGEQSDGRRPHQEPALGRIKHVGRPQTFRHVLG